jgi:protein-disulfide isomerase/uncharacterized membrane protein
MTAFPESTQLEQAAGKPARSWIRWAAVILAVAGWWMSFDLVKVGAGKEASNPWLQAECGAEAAGGGTFDCQSVLNSSWASVPLASQAGSTRIPLGVIGMAYFGFVGLWYLFVGPPTRRRWAWHLLIALVVGVGALQSLYLIWVMGGLLHQWCHGCLVTHAINFGLAVLTLTAFPWARDRRAVRPHPSARLALATLSAGAFLFLLHLAVTLALLVNGTARQLYQAHLRIVEDPDFVRWHYQQQPVHDLAPGEAPVYVGDAEARNTVVAFIDFQCPACKSARDALQAVMEKRPGQLRIDYRHFPLDLACNPELPRSAHPAACRASFALEAARVAGGAEGYRQMRALLYARHNQVESAAYMEWAKELGLDVGAFSAALRSDAVRARIGADIELGRSLGVEAIPVLFLNGRRVHYWSKPGTWEALLVLDAAADDDEPPPSADSTSAP